MKVFTFKKNIYLLSLAIITLLGIVIVPTYAKFIKDYTTSNDVAGMSLSFNIGITNIEEYEVITVPAGGADTFNVKVTNSSDSALYYGVWHRMVEPAEKNSNITIARIKEASATTSGELLSNTQVTPAIIIVNNTDTDITINIGVSSSSTSVNDIEYIGGRKLVNGVYSVNYMNSTNGTNYFNNDTYRNFITTASFVDYIDTSNAALDENEASIMWDMSSNQDNRIIAWLEENDTTDEEGNKYYDLYIGSTEKIYTKNLSKFFNSMSSLLSISFNNLDTSLTNNMFGMFMQCINLVELDLSNWNTGSVTDMSNMFSGCDKLTTTIYIMNTGTTSYSQMFSTAATTEGASITVYYVSDNPETTEINESTESLVGAMITTGTGNIINGGCHGDYCTVT